MPPGPDWEDELWEWIINTDVGNPWPEPSWFDQPALGRTTINTPHDLQLLRELNKDKPYIEQIRPGTFLTLAHAHPIEGPGLVIAPYTSDPNEALQTDQWINRGTGRRGFRIRTDRPEYVIDRSVAVLDYRHYAMQYMSHREWKSTNVDTQQTGELGPRSVAVETVIKIGGSRGSVAWLLASEVVLVLLLALGLAGTLTLLTSHFGSAAIRAFLLT